MDTSLRAKLATLWKERLTFSLFTYHYDTIESFGLVSRKGIRLSLIFKIAETWDVNQKIPAKITETK